MLKMPGVALLLLLSGFAGALLHPLTILPRLEAETPARALAAPAETTAIAGKDDEELARLYKEDQDDRAPLEKEGKPIDWSVVAQRDEARLARVKELYAANRLRTGADYYHAAMVLQHAQVPEDFLLAHELCVAAIGKGEERAKWLAAASQDRYLMNIGRPQRFGTQYKNDGPGTVWYLYQTDGGVTDELRKAYNVPSLDKAKERVAEINKRMNPNPKG